MANDTYPIHQFVKFNIPPGRRDFSLGGHNSRIKMAKQIESNRAPKFNAEEFLENLDREQQEEIRKRNIIPEGSIDGNPWDDPPAPGMTFNANIWKWVPATSDEKKDTFNWNPDETPDIRRPGYSITGKKLPDNAKLTNQSGKQSSEKSPKSDSGQSTIMTEVESVPNQEPPKSEKPPKNEAQTKPNVISKKTAPPKVKEKIKTTDTPPEESTKRVETPAEVITVTEPTIMTEHDKVDSRKKPTDATTTTKATRISARMRRASRQEFHDAYLVKTDTKGGKPITISADLIRRLYRICARSGDYRTCPTYLVNNLLSEILDIIEPETEGWADLD